MLPVQPINEVSPVVAVLVVNKEWIPKSERNSEQFVFADGCVLRIDEPPIETLEAGLECKQRRAYAVCLLVVVPHTVEGFTCMDLYVGHWLLK